MVAAIVAKNFTTHPTVMFPIKWIELCAARRTKRLKIVVLPCVRQGRDAVRVWTATGVGVSSIGIMLGFRWLADIVLLYFR